MRSPLGMFLVWALALLVTTTDARAEESAQADPGAVSQRPMQIAATLTLADCMRAFREHGFDRLLADAAAMHAEGDVDIAAHVANPGVVLSAGRSFNLAPGQPEWAFAASLSDNGAIFDLITGKRSLRADAARAALDAARQHRVSVELGLEANVKQAYAHVALARMQIEYVEKQVQTLEKSVVIARLRAPKVIDEGDLARVEVQKLRADQTMTSAVQTLRNAQLGLALLLGVRGAVPDFDVDRSVLAFRVPSSLATASEASLLAQALRNRPEVAESHSRVAHAEGSVTLERRRVFPDIGLGAFVAGQGNGLSAISPPLVGGTVSLNLPVFYQQQGEVRRAEADVRGYSVLSRKVEAQITLDVGSAFAAFRTTRSQVERMLGAELDAAKRQRDVLQNQFDAGTADLNDFLDAQRIFLNVELESLQFVANYWNAVFALERAIGTEVR